MPDTLTDAAALLRGIVDHPREWDRLLVYADWLDEHGGGPCGRCDGCGTVCDAGGAGYVGTMSSVAAQTHVRYGDDRACPDCGGTGRTDTAAEALGWRLLAGARRWPFWLDDGPRMAWWYRLRRSPYQYRPDNGLPPKVFKRLQVKGDGNGIARYLQRGGHELVAALVDAARAFAGAWLAGWRPG